MPMFEYGSHWSGWDIALMWFAMLAFWGLIIWAIYFVVSGLSSRRVDNGVDEPRRILDQRLASGVLGEDEYRRLRGLLEVNGPMPVGGSGR